MICPTVLVASTPTTAFLKEEKQMKTEHKFTEELLYEEYKITARNDGRYSCSLPAYDIIDEAGKKHRKYVTIYGEDPNEVRLNRANYIKEKIEQQTLGAMSKELLITKMEDWLYHQKLHKIKPTSFDRLEQVFLHQIIPALDELGLKELRCQTWGNAILSRLWTIICTRAILFPS